jgi:class 3 adenylate cyclase
MPMMPLRTTVLMKTDIAGSTPKLRALLAADQQALFVDHRRFVTGHAAEYGGQIIQSAGDGFWIEFPSVTSAAKSAITMQEALRLAQPNRGDNRLSIRIVIGVGDIAMLDGVLVGDAVPLIVRVETITPADEIYLTLGARLALTLAEVQTTLVDSFLLQGFADPITVYRVEQRHRTRIIPDAYILYSDLRGFTRLVATEPVEAVERVLDTVDLLSCGVAREFGGTVHYSSGDSYCVTYPGAAQLIAAAERLSRDWQAAHQEKAFSCAINIALHRGKMCLFRSFLYGDGVRVAMRVQAASTEVLPADEGSVFLTGVVRDELLGSPWDQRLRPVALARLNAQIPGLEVYRLSGPWLGPSRR